MKLAEQVTGRPSTPSINELRYAGRKIIEAAKASATGDEASAKDLLRDARMDCLRAQHDAVDVAVALMAENVAVTTRQVGMERTAAAFPEVGDFIMKLSSAQQVIADTRADRDERRLRYETLLTADLPVLKVSFDKLKACQPYLIDDVRQARRREFFGYAVGAAGVLVAILALIL